MRHVRREEKGRWMGGFDIDAEAVRTLAGLLDETGLGEIEYEVDDRRIRVAKPGVAVAAPAALPAAAAQTNAAAAHGANGSAAAGPEAGAVPSPMVGTAYLQSGPGEAPFVKVGDRVNVGDVILIVEAMKVMNQIPAAHGGVVTDIRVENGQAVEFGETLMVIE